MKPLSRVKYQGAPGIGAVMAMLLGLLLLGQSATLFAAPPGTNGNRFLLILDTSLAMKPLETPQREATFDLIYSGLRGHMTNGDTYGLWLAGEKNDTSFPMESWKLKHAVEMAAKAAVHLKDRGYKGTAGINAALADVGRVIKNVGDLTVVLVSNGEAPVKGTPFDDPINARFAELAPAMKQAGATLNTVLVAQDGEFVAWAVNSPDFLIEVPTLPTRSRQKQLQAAQAEKAAAAKAEATNEKPRVAASPIIITRESVAQEKRTYSAATTLQVEPVVAAATNPASSDAIATVAPALVPSGPVLTATNAPALAAPAKAAVTNSVVVATLPPPHRTAAVLTAVAPKTITSAVAPAAVTAPAVASVSSQDGGQIVRWLLTGAGAMLVLVLVAFLLARSSRAQPSLISQSLLRQREG